MSTINIQKKTAHPEEDGSEKNSEQNQTKVDTVSDAIIRIATSLGGPDELYWYSYGFNPNYGHSIEGMHLACHLVEDVTLKSLRATRNWSRWIRRRYKALGLYPSSHAPVPISEEEATVLLGRLTVLCQFEPGELPTGLRAECYLHCLDELERRFRQEECLFAADAEELEFGFPPSADYLDVHVRPNAPASEAILQYGAFDTTAGFCRIRHELTSARELTEDVLNQLGKKCRKHLHRDEVAA